jgi:hypothetical protein
VRLVSHLFLVSLLLGPVATRLPAQQGWGLSLELGRAGFHGHARSVGISPETSGHPSAAGTYAIRIDRTGRRTSFSIAALIATTGVEFESEDASAEVRNLLELIEISPEIAIQVFHPREVAVRLHAGVVLDRWRPEGENSRTALGALGAVSLEVPLSHRVGVTLRWQADVTGSVFDEDDLPPDFERRSGWSERWVVGARYRL